MILDITPPLSGETDRLTFEGHCLEDPQDQAYSSFPDLIFSEPPAVSGSIVNHSGYMLLSMTLRVSYSTCCARCLKELKRDGVFSFERSVAAKGALEEEDTDDYLIAENSRLDLDSPAEETLLLELPLKTLCRDDCKGLCPKCGHDLNDGPCGCSLSEPDPRLAVLAKLLS